MAMKSPFKGNCHYIYLFSFFIINNGQETYTENGSNKAQFVPELLTKHL